MKRDQLDYVQFDVDFFDKPKIQAVMYLGGCEAVCFLIRLYMALGRSTNAEMSKRQALGVAYSLRIEDELANKIITHCIAEGMLLGSGEENGLDEIISAKRIAEDQENIAQKREIWREKENKRKKRESISKDSLESLNTEDLNTEDLNTLEKKGGQGEEKQFEWIDSLPIPKNLDETRTKKALKAWAKYAAGSIPALKFSEIQAEALLSIADGYGQEIFSKAVRLSVTRGYKNIIFEAVISKNSEKEDLEKSRLRADRQEWIPSWEKSV